MYSIEFVASEPVYGNIELDLEGIDTKEEARELAEKEVRRSYPTYENIVITQVSEISA